MVALCKHGVRGLLVCTVLVASFANFYELWIIDCSFISATSFARFSSCSPIVIFSCCSLTASASGNCIHFSYCSPTVIFSCCSLTTSASGPVAQLHSLQLLLPSCIRFICCFRIASASAAAPQLLVSAAALRMHPLQLLFPICMCLLQLLLQLLIMHMQYEVV